MPWYKGPTVLEQVDTFERPSPSSASPFRFPVQDVYKFTEGGDDRRIFAGTVTTGQASVGQNVIFLPSGKRSRIKSVEAFNAPERRTAVAGDATGFTLETQVYIRPGELMIREDQPAPQVGSRFRANLFWMGRAPMIKGKAYLLKTGSARATLKLVEVVSVLDAADFVSEHSKQQVDRHDVAECVFETQRPIAFDQIDQVLQTGRFVVVDDYEISGAGIILQKDEAGETTTEMHVRDRECAWDGGYVKAADRMATYGHKSKFVVLIGADAAATETLAAVLEQSLLLARFKAYYLRPSNVLRGLDSDITFQSEMRDEHIRRLGELARILTDSGQIFITSLTGVDEYDLRTLEVLNSPNEILIVRVGEAVDSAIKAHLVLPAGVDPGVGIESVRKLLREKKVIIEYQI
jgi:bifunctional enzyme CysN/CysC